MPFLGKMSAHFRSGGYSSKEPQSKSIYARDEDYYPSKHEHRYYASKSKIVDYDDNDFNNRAHRIENDDDNDDDDWLYRRSKEKFASWDIRDLDEQRQPTDKRIARKKAREIEDAEVEEIFVNGDSSPRRRNGNDSREEERYGSMAHRRGRASESLDRQNGKSRGTRSSEPWSEEDDALPQRTKSEERAKPARNANNRDIDNYRNEKNAGLNLGFRAIVDKFRTKNDSNNKDKKSKRQEVDWRYDNGHSNGHKDAYPPKEFKTEKNHRIRDHEYDDEPRPRRPSPDDNEDYHQSRARHQETDRSKRRSYAFEVSPDEFDVRIQKYERARRDDPDLHRRNSFHDRSDSSQRTSSRDGNCRDVTRKSSLRDKEKSSVKGKPPKPKISERHSRPLTPPVDQQTEIYVNLAKDPQRKSFSMKEWYESNRQFAAKYLKEHSKVKELSTSDVSAKDEFVFGSPSRSTRSPLELDDDYDKVDPEIDSRHEFTSLGHNEAATVVKVRTNAEVDSAKRRVGRRRRNDEERSADAVGRGRHRRESVEDEDEEEEDDEATDGAEPITRRSEIYGRSFVMPARKMWNYRDGV